MPAWRLSRHCRARQFDCAPPIYRVTLNFHRHETPRIASPAPESSHRHYPQPRTRTIYSTQQRQAALLWSTPISDVFACRTQHVGVRANVAVWALTAVVSAMLAISQVRAVTHSSQPPASQSRLRLCCQQESSSYELRCACWAIVPAGAALCGGDRGLTPSPWSAMRVRSARRLTVRM